LWFNFPISSVGDVRLPDRVNGITDVGGFSKSPAIDNGIVIALAASFEPGRTSKKSTFLPCTAF
jgi:hypothetical protein